MRKVQDYNDFIVDKIFEKLGNVPGLLPFIFSEKFEKIISDMNHPIATEILNIENETTPVTLIDVTEQNDLVSLATSPKIIDFMEEYLKKSEDELMFKDFYRIKTDKELWSKNRTTIKIGKLVKKLFGDKFPDNGQPGKDIESFVNSYKVIFNKDDMSQLFELVKGEDIQKWYDDEFYADNRENSALDQSCMNGQYDFIRFYAINEEHVNLLILYEDDTKQKIVGRALVWYLDEPEGRVFMDRIYTIHNYQIDFFKDYAKKNGWLYKSVQTYGDEAIEDPKTGESAYMDLTVKNIKLSIQYPYLDTLRYLDQDDKILSSERISDVKLIGTWGEAYDCEWSEIYSRWINMDNLGSSDYVLCELEKDRYTDDIDNVRRKDDAVYIPYYHEWISKDKYDNKIVRATIPKEQDMLKSECVYLNRYGCWADENYVDSTMKYSEYEDDYFYKDDAIFSKTMDSLIFKDDSTKVFLDITKTESDYIPDKELDKLAYTNRGDYFLK